MMNDNIKSDPPRRRRRLAEVDQSRAELENAPRKFSVGTSVLEEFIVGHSHSDVLRELVQNEYDGGGSRIEVTFADNAVFVAGNGKHIDSAGWNRLSVMLGTGSVPGSNRAVTPKINSVGSKNFGLRTLFKYGDRMYVRSGGRQTLLDRLEGTPQHSLPERLSRNRPGIHIEVPYRTKVVGKLEPFDIDKEEDALASFAKGLAPTLIKLAQPGSRKSLQELVVVSQRCRRRIAWRQTVKPISGLSSGYRVVARSVQTVDHSQSASTRGRRQTAEELEFQKAVRIPPRFRGKSFPSYFRIPGGRALIALSLRMRRGRADISQRGIFYYPLGIERGFTGNAVSVSAPFELNSDRSEIVEPTTGSWNEWLLENAADFTLELLTEDWMERFGPEAYLALKKATDTKRDEYCEDVAKRLGEDACWASAEHAPRGKKRAVFVAARDLAISPPLLDDLESFLSDEARLNQRIAADQGVRQMALDHGAKVFGVNSLVRLRCAGLGASSLCTKLEPKESSFYYTGFPKPLRNVDRQVKFATAFDRYSRRLSGTNRADLRDSPTTLTASGSLDAPSAPLWVVDPQIADVCPVPVDRQLHSSLANTRTITALCLKFDIASWARDVAKRIQGASATEEERQALYAYTLSIHGRYDTKTKAILARTPILRDHRGEWVEPKSIILSKAPGAKRLEPVLHFPHKDYSKDVGLVKAFQFRSFIVGKDLVKYARLVERRNELADDFEETLQQFQSLLMPNARRALSEVQFLRSSRGGTDAPHRLYIRNAINIACLGPQAPFVAGSNNGLYKLLGCPGKPRATDIVNRLDELRGQNRGPDRPDVLYPTLVAALRLEQRPASAYQASPIVWNGKGYGAPNIALLGSRYRESFLDAVPQLVGISRALWEAYVALGVPQQPQPQHWHCLLMWFHSKYHRTSGPLPFAERRALLEAYTRIVKLPDGLPEGAKLLLDRRGNLHSQSDAAQNAFLIGDDLALAKALEQQGARIYFADTSNKDTLRFYATMGVHTLSRIRKRTGAKVGEERDSPHWFKPTVMLQRLHAVEFASALSTVVAHEFREQQNYQIPSSLSIRSRLRELRQITFATDIEVEYSVGKSSASVQAECLVDQNRIVFLWANSRTKLDGLLSKAISDLLTDDSDRQRGLADIVFRLFTSGSSRDMIWYLKERGIDWRPSTEATKDTEEEPVHEEEADEDDEALEDYLASLFKHHPRSGDGDDTGTSTEAPEQPSDDEEEEPAEPEEEPEDQTNTGQPPAPSLPPIEDVTLANLDSSTSWSPPAGGGGGGGDPWRWTPPDASAQERDRKVGRRGEEIVFREELRRVKALGYPESRVVWVADGNPGADHDILSVDEDGHDLWIEVKATTGRDGRFVWPKREFDLARLKRDRYVLRRVYEAASATPSGKSFRDPVSLLLEGGMSLDISRLAAQVQPLGA